MADPNFALTTRCGVGLVDACRLMTRQWAAPQMDMVFYPHIASGKLPGRAAKGAHLLLQCHTAALRLHSSYESAALLVLGVDVLVCRALCLLSAGAHLRVRLLAKRRLLLPSCTNLVLRPCRV